MDRGTLFLATLLGTAALAGGAAADELAPTTEARVGVDVLGPADLDPESLARRARALAGVGPVFVQVGPFPWQVLEPAPPGEKGRPGYRWDALDAVLRPWHAAGIDVLPVIAPRSAWASSPFESSDWAVSLRKELPAAVAEILVREGTEATPPKADAWRHWERFFQDLVERYDGDGILDMPGLSRRVRSWRILDRPSLGTSWAGSVEEYLRLLHHADLGGHRAWEEVRLVHGGVEVPSRRPEEPLPAAPLEALAARRAEALRERSLEMARLFQALPFVGDPDEVAPHLASAAAAKETWIEDPGVESTGRPDPAQAERAAAVGKIERLAKARRSGAHRVLFRPRKASVDGLVHPADGRRLPAWYALRQWLELVPATGPVRDMNLGTAASGLVFSASSEAGARWVAVVLPGKARENVALRLPRGRYAVVRAAFTDAPAEREEVEAPDGILLLAPTDAPVYVVPSRVEGS